MKVRWNQEYKTKSVYVFITGALLMLFLAILLNLAGELQSPDRKNKTKF